MKAKQYKINLPVSVFKEANVFVAYTPALDISSCGNTLEEAQQSFEELVQIFFEELERKNTLEEVLFSLGWEKQKQNWSPPVEVHHGMKSFSIPVGA